MIPELLGYLLTGVECPTGWNGATVEDNCYYQKYLIQKKLARFYSVYVQGILTIPQYLDVEKNVELK